MSRRAPRTPPLPRLPRPRPPATPKFPGPPHPVHPPTVARLLEERDRTVLDLIDNLLNRGVVLTGDVVLGLAGVDLVYLRLSVLLCAADRVGEARPGRRRRRRRG
jgi:Gas vesicle protein